MTEPTSNEFARSLEQRYEVSEVGTRGIGWFIACFLVSLGLILALVAWFLGALEHVEDAGRPKPSPLALPSALPPEPRLQPSPGHETLDWQDLQKLHAREQQRLNSYGWVDRDKGIVHIPIDRALDLAIRQNLLAGETTTRPAQTKESR